MVGRYRILHNIFYCYACLLACLAAPAVGVADKGPTTGFDKTSTFDRVEKKDVKVDKDVVYSTVGDTKLLMDIYEPDGFTGKRPGIILVHGGGWAFGNKAFYAPMGKALALRGYVAFSIDYRLLPKFRYPAQLDDAQAAVRYMRAHADAYNLDPERIGALGDSAGGYLVAMLGTRDTKDNSNTDLAKFSSKVQCVVDFYGPADFTVSSVAASQQAVQIVTAFLGKKPEEDPALYKESSPITYVGAQSAPFLIIHGTADPLVPVDQSQRLFDALRDAGARPTLFLAYKQSHGFLNPANPASYGALAEEFFGRILKP